MTALSDQLIQVLQRTDLVSFAAQLSEAVADEQRRRQQFRADLGVKFKHGEFINGEVIVASPMKLWHRQAIRRLVRLLEAYIGHSNVGMIQSDGPLIKTTRNDYEPDVCLWLKAVSDGFARDQTVFPPPAFIAEVLSPSTEKRDRGVKFEDYAAHGVGEYWNIDPEAETVECYRLEGQTYALREKLSSASGATLRSEAIAGFAVPVAALCGDEAMRVALSQENR